MTPTRFKQIRRKLGLSTTELAKKIPVAERSVRRYEDGTRKIGPLVAEKMNRLADEKGSKNEL